MAVRVYTDATLDNDFTTPGNYVGGVIPADGDTFVANDQSLGPCDVNCDAAGIGAKALTVIVEKTMRFHLGAAATKFGGSGNGANKVLNTLVFSGASLTPSYFDTAAAKTSDRIVIDTQSARDDACILSGAGDYTDVIVRNGKPKIDATTITGKIEVMAGVGTTRPVLNIPAGSTLSGTLTIIMGGTLNCETAIPDVIVNGGEFILGGNVGIATRLEIQGGTAFWDAAASTIALVDLFGGMLKTRLDRTGRVLTNMNVHGTGMADFSVGGRNITFTNPPRIYGDNPVRMPTAMTVSFGA